jgi:uncharacterized protein
MQLYVGSSSAFITDATRNEIARKLKTAFLDTFHYNPSPQEIRSWQNSLLQMAVTLQVGGMDDQGVLLEYQLPLSSRRLDVMVTGENAEGHAQSVIVELKQWDNAVEASNAEGNVAVWMSGRIRDELHPSQQAYQYAEYLRDVHSVFSKGEVGIQSCAYLHNLTFDSTNEIYSPRHAALLEQVPAFAGDQQAQLAQFLQFRVAAGNVERVLDAVLASKYIPSKKLLDHTAQVIADQTVYVLLDEQQAVFSKVVAEVREAASRPRKKTVFIVRGGPGTGKSVIALRLVGALSNSGLSVLHLTGSKAFTENMRRVVGNRAGALFKYFNFNKKGDVPADQFDALILDEAHRIRASSKDRFTKPGDWSGLPQIDELMRSAKVCVFFIDDRQIVRPGEVGSTALLAEAAKRNKAVVLDYELESQFRCNGSDGFINWVDNTLGIRKTANGLWERDDPYEVKVFGSVQDLEAAIREKSIPGQTARLVAGYCWPWSEPNSDGTLQPDVKIDEWKMPWNAKANAGRLARGIPKSDFWASDPGGLEQVGCVYTAQGFEFDYVGVIFGRDLRYDSSKNDWISDYRESNDGMLTRMGRANFTQYVKNTYRVLLTRGIKGCYLYFLDDDTRRFFENRMQ